MDTPTAPPGHSGGIGKPDLFSKVGPLPAWAWGAIVVVGFLAYRHFGSKAPAAVDPGNLVDGSLTSPATDFADSGSGGGGGAVTSYDPSSSGYNYGDVLAGSYTGSTTGAVFSTNQQWGVYAVNNLPKQGYAAGEVVSAITFYLAGMPLTSNQAAIVQAALSNYGSPPLPLPINLTNVLVGGSSAPQAQTTTPAVETPAVVIPPTTSIPDTPPVSGPVTNPIVIANPIIPPAAPYVAPFVPMAQTPALAQSAAVNPGTLPKQTAANDALIRNTPYHLLTARQIAYADMYGIGLQPVSS